MHTTGSFLYTVLEKIRFHMDEAALDAKYDDDFLIRYFILPAMTNVLARLNMSADDPVVVRHQIDLVVGQQYYQLPPNIQEIWRFAIMDEFGRITADAYPRGEFNPFGPGWAIEGNLLSIRPYPTADQLNQTSHIWYVPTGDIGVHYHNGSASKGAVASDNTTFTLATTPTLGVLDKRPSAYAGQVLRILGSGVRQERVIATHDASSNAVTVRVPFSPSLASTTGIVYEIAPAWSQSLYDAIALMAAIEVAVGRKSPQAHIQNLMLQQKISMKTIKDAVGFRQLRTGKAYNKNTVDNPERTWGTWTSWSYTAGP